MLLHTDEAALADAIEKEFPSMEKAFCERYAKKVIAETDECLEENLNQWMRNEPLSEIWIGKYCIGMVLSIRGNRNFLDALDALNLYALDPAAGERRIWRTTQ